MWWFSFSNTPIFKHTLYHLYLLSPSSSLFPNRSFKKQFAAIDFFYNAIYSKARHIGRGKKRSFMCYLCSQISGKSQGRTRLKAGARNSTQVCSVGGRDLTLTLCLPAHTLVRNWNQSCDLNPAVSLNTCFHFYLKDRDLSSLGSLPNASNTCILRG